MKRWGDREVSRRVGMNGRQVLQELRPTVLGDTEVS